MDDSDSKRFHGELFNELGNDAPRFTRIMGKKATLVNTGGEGSPRWPIVEEKRNQEQEDDLTVDGKRAVKDILLPGNTSLPPMGIGDEDPSHMSPKK